MRYSASILLVACLACVACGGPSAPVVQVGSASQPALQVGSASQPAVEVQPGAVAVAVTNPVAVNMPDLTLPAAALGGLAVVAVIGHALLCHVLAKRRTR